MKLIDDMVAEHRLIERVLGSFRTYVERRLDGSTDDIEAAAAFGRFFRLYAGDFHHAREEDVLFAALVEHVELPADRGPIAAVSAQHVAMAVKLNRLLELLAGPIQDAGEVRALAVGHSHALWSHIDAEDSVLFPESRERLVRAGVPELTGRVMTAEEAAARAEGEALLAAFPPLVDDDLVRGEGCVVCSSYGVDCDGLEHEWWTDAEWEDLDDRIGSD